MIESNEISKILDKNTIPNYNYLISKKYNVFSKTYMDKISANVNENDVIDLDYSIKKNIENLADFKNTTPSNLTACVMDRPRHK